MSARYVLDTNIVSDLIRNPRGRVAVRIAQVGENNVCISLIVSGEIRCGTAQRNSPRLALQAETVLSVLPVAPMEIPTDRHYLQMAPEHRAALVRDNTRRLYMAFTRAGVKLVVTWVGPPPEWAPKG